MPTIGVIGGSGLLKSSLPLITALERTTVYTERGHVVVHTGEHAGATIAFVQRHGADPAAEYTQPALINYGAISLALAKLGCDVVVGVASVGALHKAATLGAIVVPDDYWCPWDLRSSYTDYRAHFVPGYDDAARADVIAALTEAGLEPFDGGVYVNSKGPRFETKAEIRTMAAAGTIVGMTGAHEATACKEVGLRYATFAVVDNYANGVSKSQLTVERFKAVQHENMAKVETALVAVVARLAAATDSASAATDGAAGAGAGAGAGAADGRAAADKVVHARWVVCVEPEGVLENHAVVVKDGDILDVLPSAEADAKYTATTTERLGQHVLMPGFINAHAHSPMVYFRGLADDLPLLEWLSTAIWPAEAKFVGPEFVRDGAVHAAAEMIRCGTTMCNDMYFFPKDSAEAIASVGMRVATGMIVIEFPSAYASNADDYFAKGLAMYEEFEKRRAEGDEIAKLVTVTAAAHAPYTVCDASLTRVNKISEELGVPIHIHLHETADECECSEHGIDGMSRHKSEEKCRPFKNLDRLGLINPRLIAVHMTQLNDEEIATLADKGGHVVHCPSSNLKLASGFCRVSDLVKAGVNVCLGTDGASSNNSLDVMAELKLAAILAKAVGKDAATVPARQALRMATINGAKALGVADRVGTLEVGKAADMVAVALDDVDVLPVYDVESHLVYTCTRNNVTDVWVNGRRLLANRKLTTVDTAKIHEAAKSWSAKIRAYKAELTASKK